MGCYAPPVPAERKMFWELLYKLHKLRSDENERWIIGGDFNEIWYASEKQGGNTKKDCYSAYFRECCIKLNLQNLPALGPKYT